MGNPITNNPILITQLNMYKPTELACIMHADRCRLLFITQNSTHGHHKAMLDKKINRIQTFSAENTREGAVKGRRLGPPRRICFLTVHMICKAVHKTIKILTFNLTLTT